MTRDEIIEMARHIADTFGSRLCDENGDTHGEELYVMHIDDIVDAIKLVAAKEREACAKLAQETICDTHIPTGVNIYGTRAAKAIRARGEA